MGSKLVPIAVESYYSVIGELHHDPMRYIANKFSVKHPSTTHNPTVDYASLSMSHTVRPEGSVPTILAFGAQPRQSTEEYNYFFQTVRNRTEQMNTAGHEYELITASLYVPGAMNTANPNESEYELTPGEKVLVHRDKNS